MTPRLSDKCAAHAHRTTLVEDVACGVCVMVIIAVAWACIWVLG